MPKAYRLRKVAYALRVGINLAYRGRLRESKQEVLYEILDDMALALTRETVEEENPRFEQYAWILGELGDLVDIPLPNSKRKKKRK